MKELYIHVREHRKKDRLFKIKYVTLLCYRFLPPQGFHQEAKSRGGTLVARTCIKDSTYSSNMQSVY